MRAPIGVKRLGGGGPGRGRQQMCRISAFRRAVEAGCNAWRWKLTPMDGFVGGHMRHYRHRGAGAGGGAGAGAGGGGGWSRDLQWGRVVGGSKTG